MEKIITDMIPKKIHYCWFGGSKYSKLIKKCMVTWHHHLPEYQFFLWDESNSPMHHPYVQSACKQKKYAFASDYVRLWALYNHGGIYLDTDMFVIRDFDELLSNAVFFGTEKKDELVVNAALFGATMQNQFIWELLKKYDLLKFDKEHIDDLRIPLIITKIYNNYAEKDKIIVYPYDVFYPFPFKDRKDSKNFMAYKTPNTIAIHLWDKSWYGLNDKLKYEMNHFIQRVKKLMRKILKMLTRI